MCFSLSQDIHQIPRVNGFYSQPFIFETTHTEPVWKSANIDLISVKRKYALDTR